MFRAQMSRAQVSLAVSLAATSWLGCADVAPAAHEAPTSALAAPVNAASASAPAEAPWLVNVANAKHEAGRLLPCPPHVPEALNPPADATLELAWPASGVQIYACTQPKPSDTPSWTLEGPHALLTSGNTVAAIHFAGPHWQGLDGSQVKGAKLASADAPDAAAVPWLLMSATPSGEGTFAHTTHIQRLDTNGGKPPTTGCDASHLGAKALVPYRASYYFYRHANAGESIQQCRAKPAKADNAAKPAPH
ncbi:MAG TPA: DUF3455 domain-containing protein [Polyangiaceae bacterium]|nr:DUF3455 domain-containing protein [Polyangiaceae bacterium]